MTEKPNNKKSDQVWEEALDWLLRIHTTPNDATTQEQLAAWLAQSEDHMGAYRKAVKVWRLIGALPPAHAGRWTTQERFASNVADQSDAPSPLGMSYPTNVLVNGKESLWRCRWLKASLIVSIGAVCLLLFFSPTLWLRIHADYVTGVGESKQILLEDGTIIVLSANSAVTKHYTSSHREIVLLEGEVFLTIASDKFRPFSISAGEMTVIDIGTAFDISLSSKALVIAVQDGGVQVKYNRSPQPIEVTLNAGDRLRINRLTSAVLQDTVATTQIAAWRNHQLVINDIPIAQVVDELSRFHHGIILVSDQALAARKVTGTYNLRDPAEALRAAVEPHAGVVRELTPYILIVSGR